MSEDYEKTFDEFWADIVLDENGKLNVDQVKRELHDYRMIIKDLPRIFDVVTNGRITKPNTDASVVIAEFEDQATEAVERASREEVIEFLTWLLDNYTVVSWIKGGEDFLNMRLTPEEWIREHQRRLKEGQASYDPTDGTDMRSAHHKDVG